MTMSASPQLEPDSPSGVRPTGGITFAEVARAAGLPLKSVRSAAVAREWVDGELGLAELATLLTDLRT